jgi:hypothetical protein
MPKLIIRNGFEPGEVDIAVKAFERAAEFLRSSGDADDDPDFERNLARHIVKVGKELRDIAFLELANRAISLYRIHRAQSLVQTAKREREQERLTARK